MEKVGSGIARVISSNDFHNTNKFNKNCDGKAIENANIDNFSGGNPKGISVQSNKSKKKTLF